MIHKNGEIKYKRKIIILLLIVNIAALTACSEKNQGDIIMDTSTIFEKGDRGPEKFFSNTVWVKMLHTDEKGVFDTKKSDYERDLMAE